jgi:hypothetical protein
MNRTTGWTIIGFIWSFDAAIWLFDVCLFWNRDHNPWESLFCLLVAGLSFVGALYSFSKAETTKNT